MTAALAVNASAQEMPQSMPSDVYYQGSWGINGELFNFDPVEAYYDGVSDTGFGLGAGYAGEYGLFNFNIGIGAILVDDEDEFSQQVEYDWSGDRSTESSSISALTAMVDAGVQFPLTDSRRFLVGLNAGYRHLDMSREITNCSDCYSENIYISGDTYLKPFVKLAFNQRVNGSLALYQYSGDQGLEDSVQFQVNWEI
ncbi:outer membrane beta-barrel protein [Microbulbifer hydrolyticus]|uniref:Outer membrane protein beta-barrel domain-containing protein n=1 Tax=Microbulbifer hydrolyticus TaxID=48074 RepID=A0A6P1TE94_9GAMM|nr:outer membrane beta-barrel protein [Microbulbifer hydrolyticus]MBB5212542.1 hypothetical protein [Microbulbifer hydrolyticus]QHQ40161.1 hypothetical protein GTQ55_15025 [Microbulbifer hydrolyticus]